MPVPVRLNVPCSSKLRFSKPSTDFPRRKTKCFAVSWITTVSPSTWLLSNISPGLINTHTHIAMGLFRNYADDLELMDWLETAI
ncbi:MAG: amidohydrolase family protein, partial [Neisseria mucosa]|nr:amidohydrolase family protein [Neisseria mucosa]